MTEVVQLTISGTAQGIIYALLAIGFNVTFSVSKTVDFSLGTVLMMGGVVGFCLYMDSATGQPIGRSFIIPFLGVMLTGVILGAFIFQIAINPALRAQAEYTSVLTTLAVGMVLRNFVSRWWSTDDFRFESPLGNSPIRILGAGVYPQEILNLVIAVIIVAAIEIFRRKTPAGKVVQALSEDPEMVSLLGINGKLRMRIAFMFSALMAAIAGLMVAPLTMVSATMGTTIGIKAYAVAVIGGLESTYGALIAGLLLGLSETFTARYISSGYRDMTGFIILILILLIKPNGLLGKASVRKV